MRKHLLNSVAVAALSLSVAGAIAQEQRSRPEGGTGSPSAQSDQRGNAPARSERGEERSQQGQRASEGAGREGAGRNASERGQERGERGQPSTAQQGREQGQGREERREQSTQQERERSGSSPSSAQQQQQQQREQERSSSTNAQQQQQQRERDQQQQRTNAQQEQQQRDQQRTQSQQNQQSQQPSAQQRNQDQQRNDAGRTETPSSRSSSSTTTTDTNRQQQGAQDRDRPSSTSTQSRDQQDRNRDNAASSTSTSSSTRTGERNGGSQTNVQVRGEFNIDQQAATRVHDRLIRESDARSRDVNINIDVGRNLPNSVRLRPVPRDIVEINPRYRDYEYTIVRDEIVIVEPRTKKVVQIISSGGGRGRSSHMVRLDTHQRDLIKRDVMRTRTGSRGQDYNFELREGVEVPDRVTLQTFPEDLWREVPDLREVRYIIVRDELVLVDPDTREIIEIIR